ncbi:hypothetical protein [Pseudomonas sp. R5(2019)]|uniref:hypothetical protein n=1 Tax=Pseudomonas sp. R5(2019) TaxID=2697566 RepID=UPI001412F1DA|nr:hypothetical protein [Pseudomonas sp. R5(2019)]NBA94199.1 hypothetical protein [Pseudomonas sp. R5(2019)]
MNQSDRDNLELDKLQGEVRRLMAETRKLMVEADKLKQEATWYPFVAAGGVVTVVITATGLMSKL